MNEHVRSRFDALVSEAIDALPEHLHALLDEVPVVVLDRPTAAMLKDLGLAPDDALDLCGLHTGVAFTDRAIDAPPTLPTNIHLFREGILELVNAPADPDQWDTDAVFDEIAITLLHEIGHQFGLDEDDLADLGYD